MGSRLSTKIGPFLLASGGLQQTSANTNVVNLAEEGLLSVVCTIDNGTDGVAPTDLPAGAFQLWVSAGDEYPFVRVVEAETGTFSLAAIAPNGNNVVAASANFESVPGARAQLRYAYSSGGTTARATLYVTVS